MYKCKYCEKEFENKSQLGAHSRNIHFLPKKKLLILNKTCVKCGKSFTIEYFGYKIPRDLRDKKCCSSFCSHGRSQTNESNLKRSKKLKGRLRSEEKETICENCGKIFKVFSRRKRKYCSLQCYHDKIRKDQKYKDLFRQIGCNAAQRIQRRSKNEVLFASLCKNKFKLVLENECIFDGWDSDIIIEDIKYAVHWNGVWHYKQIGNNHSLKQVQNRDKIKLDKIKEHGYTSYIIKDLGDYNPKFVEDEFNKFLEYIAE